MAKQQKHTVRKKQRHKADKTKHSHPHDSVFKKIFKRPGHCRALLQILLSPSFYTIFNWAAMKITESVAVGTKGQERRADIVLEVPLLNSKSRVIITIILEHKSYRDNNTILQILGYYNEIAQQTGGIILPIIVTCCKDKKAVIPSDYLSWALQRQGAPEELKKQLKKIANFACPLVNLHDLSYRRIRRGGEAVSLALFGIRNYRDMDEEVVVKILKQARLLPQQEREFMLNVLMDYYECADKGYGWSGFSKVERKRFPRLKEEERIVPEMEFSLDKAKRQGMQQGMRKGIEQGRLETAKRLLLDGVDEQTICRAAQLSKQELAKIKRSIDRN